MNEVDLLRRLGAITRTATDSKIDVVATVIRVVRAHEHKLNRIHARPIAEMQTELQEIVEETSSVLTPDQDARFRTEARRRLDLYFPADGRSPNWGTKSKAPPSKEAN
jgi:hypothetical protein